MIATGTRGGAGSRSEEAGLRNKVNGFGVLVLVAKKKGQNLRSKVKKVGLNKMKQLAVGEED